MIYPLMPKGVEHQDCRDSPNRHGRVIYPLMPKGVEHFVTSNPFQTILTSDLSVDAERR